MKKVLAISLTVLMVVCMSFTAFAKTGEFVYSPSNNGAPEIVDSKPGSEDCDATIVVTPFRDRENLSKSARDLLEKAYKDIANSKNLADLCDGLDELAKKNNIPEENLAVSDLFDVSLKGCDEHGKHGNYDITLEADTFENFVGLMQLTDDGWKLVDGAKVNKVNGEYHLTFSTAVFGPFAVVVNSHVIADGIPETGDKGVTFIYVLLAVSSVAAIATFPRKSRKETV